MNSLEPKQPKIDEISLRLLNQLAANVDAEGLVIGGGTALMHYTGSHRQTFDLVFWWDTSRKDPNQALLAEMESLAASLGGRVETRVSRDGTVTMEVHREGSNSNSRLYNASLATRPLVLEPPRKTQWGRVRVDSFRDNVAAKMTALVARGHPRDFADIYTVCDQKLLTCNECWELFSARNTSASIQRAKVSILTSLGYIERYRPLESISDEDERSRAKSIREWYKSVFTSSIK